MKKEHVIERCPTCGHTVSDREISLYSGMVRALWLVYKWCLGKNRYEFTRKDIKHLFKNENDTARFGDWVMFGGLIYKLKKGSYGLNLERAEQFFAGRYRIPLRLLKNSATGNLSKLEEGTIKDIPTILKFLNEDGEYITMYRQHDPTLF
jgi:hypothetical protein